MSYTFIFTLSRSLFPGYCCCGLYIFHVLLKQHYPGYMGTRPCHYRDKPVETQDYAKAVLLEQLRRVFGHSEPVDSTSLWKSHLGVCLKRAFPQALDKSNLKYALGLTCPHCPQARRLHGVCVILRAPC